MRLWLTFEEASPYLGDSPEEIKDAIRNGDFPFEYVRIGRRIKISARSIGLIPDFWGDTERMPQKRTATTEPQTASAAA